MKILVFLCDGGNKYVSKIFNDDWMRENGFLEDQPGLGTVRDMLAAQGAAADRHGDAGVQGARRHRDDEAAVDQPAPGRREGQAARHRRPRSTCCVTSSRACKTLDSPIGDIVESDYATVTLDTKIELLQGVLADAKVAIVTDREEVVGIVTKIDLIDFLARQSAKGATLPRRRPRHRRTATAT